MHDTPEDDGAPAEKPARKAALRHPPLLLAGVEEDERELHLVRGID